MSARSKKVKPATESSVATKSTLPSTPISQGISNAKSNSPLGITRNEEKEELAYLNNRLAGYIEYVRTLETDNEKYQRRIKLLSEEKFGENDKMKKTYEEELASLRALVDELANSKAKLEIEAKAAMDESRDAKQALSKSEASCSALDRKIEQLEKELSFFRSSADRVDKLKSENEGLKRKCETLRRDLDGETLMKTELENRVTSLREELEFRDRIINDEKDKYSIKSASIEEEIDSRKAREYESRLAEELRAIREQTADELEDYKIELENAFQAQIESFQTGKSDASGEAARYREELMSLRKKYDEVMSSMSSRNSEMEELRKKNHELQKKIEKDRESFEDQFSAQRSEISRLNQEIARKVKEFSELLHIKILLDQEILMYRKMLEGEESRLKLTTPPRDSSFNIRVGKKRRLDSDGDLEESYSSFLSGSPLTGRSGGRAKCGYQVITKTTSDVEFDKNQNGCGKFIRLVNNSSKDVNISGWVLKQVANGDEVSYTFPARSVIKANCSTTVWSSSANGTHSPPNNIVMSDANFNNADNVSICLMGKDMKEQASCTITREVICPATRTPSRRSASGNQDDRCSIM